MLIGKEERQGAAGFSSFLDYHLTIEGDSKGCVQLLSTGTFLAAWKIRGPDMEGMPIEDSAALCAKLAHAFRLGAGWTVQCDQFQSPAREYDTAPYFPNVAAQLIDRERRNVFTAKGELARYRSDVYLAVSYLPPRLAGAKGVEWLFGD